MTEEARQFKLELNNPKHFIFCMNNNEGKVISIRADGEISYGDKWVERAVNVVNLMNYEGDANEFPAVQLSGATT